MTRKHYEMIAEQIAAQFEIAVDEDSLDTRNALRALAYSLADEMKMESDRFDYDRFINAAIPY